MHVPSISLITAPVTALVTRIDRVVAPLTGDLRWLWAPRQRTCVACGLPLHDDDPFLRYRGDYFHAEPCLEQDLPALRAYGHRSVSAAGGSHRAWSR